MSDTDLAFRATLDGSGFARGAQSINGHLHQMGIATNSATASLGPLGTILGSMASPLSLVALGATAVGGALVGSVQAAAAWESSMSGVAKTTGMAGPALQQLSGELLEMSTNIPIAASELASIAQAGGSLGIAKEELAGFTEVAAQMGVGFEMSAAQAATAGAKILTAFQTDVSAENLRNLGNVVNKMGDDFPATEAQVLEFTNRASYLNTTFGMSVPAVAAWGTALISAGMEAENASTGIKSLMTMSLDPKKFDAFAEAAGMSAEELKTALNEDVAGAYEMVAEKIASGTDAVEKFQTVSKLAGTEGMTTLMKMGGAAYQGADALKKANAEWENGTSLAKTFAAQSETVNAQWTMFTNTVGVAATELGTVLLPVVSDVLELMTGLTKSAIEAGESISSALGGIKDTYFGEDANRAVMDFFGYGPTADQMAYEASQAATSYTDEWGNVFEGDAMKGKLIDPIAEALEGTKDAGKAAGEDTAKAFADGQKAWLEANAAYVEAGYNSYTGKSWTEGQSSKTGYAGLFGRGTVDTVAEDQGLNYKIHSKATKFDTEVSLYVDGQEMASGKGYGSKEEALKDLFDKGGFPLSEAVSLRLQGRAGEAAKIELESPIEVENLWDVSHTQKSWLKFNEENKDLASIAGREIMTDLYEAQIKTIEANDPTLNESLANVMKGLASPGSVSAELFNVALADLIDVGFVAEGHKKAMQEIARQDAEEYKKNLVGGAKIELPSLLELVGDPSKIKGSFEDISKWQTGYFIPQMNNNVDEIKKLMESGVNEDKIYDAYVKPLDAITEYMPRWLDELGNMYEQGQISLADYVSLYEQMTTTAKDASVSKADSMAKSAGMFYGELIDDTKKWQDFMNSEGGYVGPTAYYDDYRQATDPNREASQQINEKYGITTMGTISLEMETMKADETKTAFEEAIKASNPEMAMSIETQAAMDEVNRLVSYIITVNPVMSVLVDVSANAGQIRAIVEDEIADALASL